MFFINPVHKFMTYASMLVGAVAMMFSLTACSDYENVSETYPLREIVLGNQKDMNGSYFLIAGGVGKHTNAYYQFYVESPDGTIALHKNKAEDVTLRLRKEGTKPFIKCSGDRIDIQPGERYDFNGSYTKYHCVFNVPESAIGTTVDIDITKVK